MNDIEFQGINKVLFLGPHPDDVEFSSGGTLTKMLESGIEVHYAVFSVCEKSIPPGFCPGAIKEELFRVTDFLGIKKENLHLFDFEVRVFPQYRQEILEEMVKLNRLIKPDIVFLPNGSDIHQDHKTIYEEGVRAFKYSRLLSYELPWNNFVLLSNLYVILKERHLKKKIEALKLYKTQEFRPYNSEEYLQSLMKMKGMQINEKYAETFQILRWKI
jgi:LmbE family N-acetylglucosaminyl deacetylase